MKATKIIKRMEKNLIDTYLNDLIKLKHTYKSLDVECFNKSLDLFKSYLNIIHKN